MSTRDSADRAPAPRLASLGMFIIDTFRFTDEHGAVEQPEDRGWGEQIGGAGPYAIVGQCVGNRCTALLLEG